jgi:hypothetical protein
VAISPVFPSYVDTNGGLHVEDKAAWARHTRKYAGRKTELVLRLRTSQRSLQQNAWIWGIAYPLLAEHWGYERNEHEQMHYGLLAQCFGTKVDTRFGVRIPRVVSSSKLSTKEFSEYMEWLVRYAAVEEKIVIPLPNEVDLSGVDE